MELEIFSLCDFAEDMGNGKMVLVGTFNTIKVANLPSTHAAFSIAVRVRLEKSEIKSHGLEVSIKDVAGTSIVPDIEGEFGATAPEGTDSVPVNMVINLTQIPIKSLGKHLISLKIDNKLMHSLPFYIWKK